VTPRFAYAWPELARVAAHIRDQRAAGDGKVVETGKMTADQAAARLRIATAVAADWAAIAALQPMPEPTATDAEKVAMLDRAAAVTAGRVHPAQATMVAAAGWTGEQPRGALWQIAEAEIGPVDLIRAYLRAESYAAAVEALAWWQRLGIWPRHLPSASEVRRAA
jgi:hypothetical protein